MFGGIFLAMHEAAMRKQTQRWWVAIVDARLHRMLKKTFHFEMEPIGPTQEYQGGICTPCVMDLSANRSKLVDFGAPAADIIDLREVSHVSVSSPNDRPAVPTTASVHAS